MTAIALIMAFIVFVPFLLLTLFMNDVPFVVRCYISLFLSTPAILAVIILAIRDKIRDCRCEHSRPGVDDIFESLVSKFEEEFPHTPYEAEKGDIKIPARDKNVGDMWIYADGNDITIGVGDLFHIHFPVDHQQPNPVEAIDKAISSALNCVRDFYADRVVLRIKYRGNRPVSARVVDPVNDKCLGWIGSLGIGSILSALLLQKSEVKDFVWSGPYTGDK